jgi:hypothetical protein
LWRIVLLTFLHANSNPTWRNEMVRFSRASQNTQAWRHASECRSIYAFDIVREALRLYPSSKRVHRVFRLETAHDSSRRATVAADVEACHRDPGRVRHRPGALPARAVAWAWAADLGGRRAQRALETESALPPGRFDAQRWVLRRGVEDDGEDWLPALEELAI